MPFAKRSDKSPPLSPNSLAEAHLLQLEYWKEFGDFLQRHGCTIRTPLPQALTTLVLNHPGFHFPTDINNRNKRLSIGLTISDTEAKQYFNSTPMEKARIESELGATFRWADKRGEQVSHILLCYDKNVDPLDRRDWAAQHAWLCEKLKVLHQIFAPHQRDSKPGIDSGTNHQPAAPVLLADSESICVTQDRQHTISSLSRLAIFDHIRSVPKRIFTQRIHVPALSQKKAPAPADNSRGMASPLISKPVNKRARNPATSWWEKQTTKKREWMIGGFIALLLITIPIVKHRPHKSVDVYNPPKGAPLKIVLKDTSGEPFALSSLRGRVVLLNIWSTWCIPCRKEIPVLNALQKEYEAKGLTVVGVSWNDTLDDIKRFQKEKTPQNYTVLLQGKSLQSTFGGLEGLPVTYLIDQQGQTRQVLLGANDRTTLEVAIRSLLNSP